MQTAPMERSSDAIPPQSSESPVSHSGRPPQLPLWLTEKEAETLLTLCAASPVSGGEVESEVFARLGELLRAFWR